MEYWITHASDEVRSFKSAFYPLVRNIWFANSGPQFTREHGPQSVVRSPHFTHTRQKHFLAKIDIFRIGCKCDSSEQFLQIDNILVLVHKYGIISLR